MLIQIKKSNLLEYWTHQSKATKEQNFFDEQESSNTV